MGERTDGLGAADPVHLVGPGDGGRGEGLDGDLAVRSRWGDQHDLVHPGGAGGHDGHQHGRGVAGPAAGHVAAGPGHRDVVLLDDHPGPVVAPGRRHLAVVIRPDLVGRPLEGVPDLGADPVEGAGHRRRGHPKVVQADPVETFGVVPDRHVAPGGHVGQDRPDGLDRLAAAERGPREVGRGVRGAATVEPGQERGEDGRHGRLTVPAPLTGFGGFRPH